jgi:hypothetical protein
MGRKFAIALLVVSTYFTALVSVAFARTAPIALDQILGAAPSESVDLPSSMGSGRRRCYTVPGPFSLVINRIRTQLLHKGWSELSVSRKPGHSLFTRGIDEIQVFEGKARGSKVDSLTRSTRLEARELHWEPHPSWVTVVVDQPSKKPLDRARGLLHDLNADA